MSNFKSSDFSTLITNRSLTVNFRGESRTVYKDDPVYDKFLSAIREERWNDIPELMKPEKVISYLSDGEMRVESGQVYVKTADGEFEVPSGLNSTILHYIEENLPFKPLVRFAANLSQNPSYRSVQQLFNFLERNNFTITEDGNFIAYKKVRDDFKDFHSETFDNSVGNILKMPRNQVDENPENHCSDGFHCGNYKYPSADFHPGQGQIVYVEVNPKNVVSVPNDFDCAKIRVCEYKVLGISKGEFKDPIYKKDSENTYGTDEELCEECWFEKDICVCDQEFCYECGECVDFDDCECHDEKYQDEECPKEDFLDEKYPDDGIYLY